MKIQQMQTIDPNLQQLAWIKEWDKKCRLWCLTKRIKEKQCSIPTPEQIAQIYELSL